ncbi:MAG: hypothetical protein HYY18_06785 [Planctomycetes bacterium]|nr:hypothetical protein [Planctomycetota bacterium]
MKRLFATALLFACVAIRARAGEDVNRMAGGGIEELRAVLELDAAQADRLRNAMRTAETDYARLRATRATVEELVNWQEGLRGRVRAILTPQQAEKYDAWLERKRRLGDEYEKALYGLPVLTELKLRASLSPESQLKMQPVADEAVKGIKARMAAMRGAGANLNDIGLAVNELRKEFIRKMVEAASKDDLRKIREYLKIWVKTPAEKLTRVEQDRLERVMRQLELADGAQSDKVRSLVSSALWHLEECNSLRRGLGKELLMLILSRKADAEMWISIYDYTTLIDIRTRRVRAVREDLKAALPTKQIAKLVAEGILE